MRTGFFGGERPSRLALWVRAQLGAERRGWVPWLAVALGAGVAGYFALRFEPPLWLGAAMAAGGALLVWQTRRVFAAMMAAAMVLAAAVGFTAAQWRAAGVGAPVLERQLFGVIVEGLVVRADPVAGGFRVVVGNPIIERLRPEATPALVRVRVRGDKTPPDIGSRIRIRASLLPPPGPSAPGAFDFQRQAWFQRLGAVGFALGQVEVLEPRKPGLGGRRRCPGRC